MKKLILMTMSLMSFYSFGMECQSLKLAERQFNMGLISKLDLIDVQECHVEKEYCEKKVELGEEKVEILERLASHGMVSTSDAESSAKSLEKLKLLCDM